MYKKLLGQTPDLADLKVFNPVSSCYFSELNLVLHQKTHFMTFIQPLAKGLRDLLEIEGDVEDIYVRNFVIEETDMFGNIQEHELVPNGRNIALTNSNRAGE